MHRTQLYIDRELYDALAAEAHRDGVTLSQVVRRRLRRGLKLKQQPDAIAALEQALGAWAHRRDLPPTDRYIRGLRRSTRWKRHGVTQSKTRRR